MVQQGICQDNTCYVSIYLQFRTVLSGMEVAGRSCQIVGNRFLLDIPDKMAVIVHRRNTDEENARLRDEWLACGCRTLPPTSRTTA